MNKYTKILIINFLIINLLAVVFSLFITNGFILAVPVILGVTLAVVYVIAKSLIESNEEMKKFVLFGSVLMFIFLSIINLIVASGTVRVLMELI